MDFSNYLNTKAQNLNTKAQNLNSSIPPKKVGKRKKNSFRTRVKPSERGKLKELKIPRKGMKKTDPRRTLQGPFTAVLSEEFEQALAERIQRSTTARNNNGMSFVHEQPL